MLEGVVRYSGGGLLIRRRVSGNVLRDNFTADILDSFGIVEFSSQACIGADLDMFFCELLTVSGWISSILKSIDGGFLQNKSVDYGFNAESVSLDPDFQLSCESLLFTI